MRKLKNNQPIQTAPGRVSRYFFRQDTGQVRQAAIDLSSGLPLNRDALAWFLTIGFVPGTQTLFSGVDCLPGNAQIMVRPGEYTIQHQKQYVDYVEPKRYAGWDLDRLVIEGGRRFRDAVTRCCETANSPWVVPISGGLDSRAILAALLELIPANQISTYTFGTPGSWDFDIGCQVAHAAGTQHKAYDLTQYEYTWERLEQIAELSDGNTDLFTYPPMDWLKRDFGTEVTYWTGFMGETLAGGHLVTEPVQDAVKHFITFNRYGRTCDQAEVLEDATLELNLSLLSKDVATKHTFSSVCEYELLDLSNRQERYIAHQIFLRGFHYATPFLDPEWVHFMLSVPIKFRQGETLYRSMLRREFPELFSLPLKNYVGLPLGAPYLLAEVKGRWHRLDRKLARWMRRSFIWPKLNYIDFAAGIRERDDLRSIVEVSLDRLLKRDLVSTTKVRELWEAHKTGRADHAAMLRLLTSLEIILCTFEISH